MVVTAVAVVLALIGVIGIAAGGGDKDEKKDVASNGTTTTSDASDTTLAPGVTEVTTPGATTTTAKAGTTGTTAKGGTTATTDPTVCPNPPAATADPGAPQAPALGTYTYVSCSDSADTTEQKVTAGSTSGGVTRRNIATDAGGNNQTSTYAYTSQGTLFESLTVDPGQGQYNCDWQPDILQYPAALHVGSEWAADSKCDLKGSGPTPIAKLTLKASAKVTSKVQYTIAGTAVNTWVVEGQYTITGFGPNPVNVKEKVFYDPTRGLLLFRHTEVMTGGTTQTNDTKLTSLTPKS
jgi:hypothetical protein